MTEMHFIFEIRVKEGYRAEDYAATWVRASKVIQRSPGARGTRLHRKIGDPSVLLAIATWESKEARDRMEVELAQEIADIIDSQSDSVDIRLIGEFEAPAWEVLPPD